MSLGVKVVKFLISAVTENNKTDEGSIIFQT